VRRKLPAGDDADGVDHGTDVPWLRVRRGHHTLACNFADGPATVPADGASAIVLATHDDVALEAGGVRLPARAGALLR